MKTINSILIAIISTGLLVGCSPETSKPKATPTHQVLTLLSPYLKGRQNTLVDLTTWLTHQAGCDEHIFDGEAGTEISRFEVPELTYFSESAVAERISQPLQKLIAWNTETGPVPTLAGTGALDLPKVLERIAGSYPAPERLIIIGSPIYKSPNGTNEDFFTGHFRTPSLGHIHSTNSPFSSIGMEKSLAGTRVYFLYPSEDTSKWPAEYEKHLRKFYSALVKSRGGVLVVFSPDLDAGFQRFDAGTAIPTDDIELASDLGPAQMNNEDSATQDVPRGLTNSITAPADTNHSVAGTFAPAQQSPVVAPAATNKPQVATNAAPSQTPAPVAVSTPAKPTTFRLVQPGTFVEIRYPLGVAVASLHVRPYAGAIELSYRQVSSPNGWYFERIDYSTQENQKWVYLPAGCDPEQAVVWINYSGGFGRLAGKLRWITPTGETQIPFSFPVLEGGDPARTHEWRRRESLKWVRINLLEVAATESVRASAKP
jgi:hypothetical protein